MFENQERLIFRASVNYLIPSLSWNECNIILLIIHWLLYIDYLSLYTCLHLQFWRSRRSKIHKQPQEVFLNILQISQESTCVGLSFLQSCKPSGLNVAKNRLLHKCFPVKCEKFWRTPILKNIWTAAFVYWLLPQILIFTILYSFTFLQITSSLLRN